METKEKARIMASMVDVITANGVSIEAAIKIATEMEPIIESIHDNSVLEEVMHELEAKTEVVKVRWSLIDQLFGVDVPSPMEKYFVNPKDR